MGPVQRLVQNVINKGRLISPRELLTKELLNVTFTLPSGHLITTYPGFNIVLGLTERLGILTGETDYKAFRACCSKDCC